MQVCSDDVSQLTDAYHQTILGLTESSNTKVAWDVSQHVLDRLWMSSATSGSAEENERLSSANPATAAAFHKCTVHACQACGYRLHPGWRGTSLRVKRPNKPSSPSAKRTIRRREQRKQRKAARDKEMKAKDQNGRRRSSLSSSAVAKTTGDVIETNQRMVVLRDDPSIGRLERSRLVLSCGRCQDNTYLKGLRREPKQHTGGGPTAASIARDSAYNKKKRAAMTSETTGEVDNLAENFEPLPRYQKKPPPRVQAAASTASNTAKLEASLLPSLSLLQQRMEIGRKKKKKKVTSISSSNKSGNLLSFLSSLNDH